MDPPRDSDPLENVMAAKSAHATPFDWVSWKLVW